MKKNYIPFIKCVFAMLFCLLIQHVSAAPTITITITAGTVPTTGSVTITATGTTGTVTYSIKKDTAANFPAAQPSNLFSNLSGGKYVAAVYDDSGVTLSDTITIFYGPGIKFTGANNIIIDGGNPVDTANPGNNLLVFHLEGVNGSVIQLARNTINNSNGKNIIIKNSEIITDSISTIGYKGIASTVDSVFISGCYVNTAHTGIEISNAKGVNITDNYIRNTGFSGLALLGSRPIDKINYTISGNTIADIAPAASNNYSGIFVGVDAPTGGRVEIVNNKIKNIVDSTVNSGAIQGIEAESFSFTGKTIIANNTISNIANHAKSTIIFGILATTSSAVSADSLIIRNNTITDLQNTSPATVFATPLYGIYVENLVSTPVAIQQNTVTKISNNLYNTSGIYLKSSSLLAPFSVINNMISEIGVLGADNTASGISVNGVLAKLYHNSIRIGQQTGGAGVYGIQIDAASTSSEIKNNIIYVDNTFNPANDTLLSIQSVPSALNKNVYYKSENTASIGNYLGASYQNINTWNAATGDNSIVYQPAFVEASDLHLDILASQNDAHLMVPLLVGVVETDFDNDSRMNCDNAAGADNFAVAAICGVENIKVTLPACMEDSVQVNFEAIGGTPPYQFSLDGGTNYTTIASIDSVMQSGNIALHFKDSIPFGTYTLSVKDDNGCIFIDSIFTVLPNSPSVEPKTDVLFVKTKPSGVGDGSSWDNAFDGKYLAWYLRNKATTGTQIYVAEGIYIPYLVGCDTMSDIRKYSFDLNHNMQMQGGYDSLSTGTDFNLYEPKTNITRLSGEIQGDADSINNSYHVVTVARNMSIQLDGFYISGGYANGGGDYQNGGGIFDNGGIAGTNVVYSHLIIENNAADYGAGIYFKSNQYSVLRELIVQNNSDLISFGGAGVFAWGNFLMENSTVSNNANASGIVSWGGDMLIRNSTISNNGKHGIEATNSTATEIKIKLENTTIAANNNTGVYLKNQALDNQITFNADNTLIINNTNNTNFSDGTAVDTIAILYTIIGNTKYGTNQNDISTLSIPVAIAALEDNGGWGKTHALLNPCENPAVQTGDPIFSGTLDQRDTVRSTPPCIGAYDGLETIQITLATDAQGDSVCVGTPIVLTATATPPAGVLITTYQWYKDGVALAGRTFDTLSISNAALFDSGKYTILISTDSTGCQRMSDTLIVAVNPAIDSALIIINSNDYECIAANQDSTNVEVTIEVYGGTAPFTVDWLVIDDETLVTIDNGTQTGVQNIDVSGSNKFSVTIPADGKDYTIKINKVTDANGCSIVY